FTGIDLVLLAVVPVVLAGLTWFLYFSDAGMAVRGMADNMDRARLLGIPVNQLSSLLWTVAGAVAALTVVLRAPSEGVPLNAAAGAHRAAPGARRRGGRRHAVAAGGVRRRRLPRRPRPGRAVERRQRGADAGRAPGGDRRGAAAPPALQPPHRRERVDVV